MWPAHALAWVGLMAALLTATPAHPGAHARTVAPDTACEGDPAMPDWPRQCGLPPLPHCAQEDGPGPCVWDASADSNGRGFSFWIDCAQVFHYLDPRADREMGGPGDAYASTC